ncbi:MAG: RNA methyltransferase [Oscillospiraceae bacterium]|nr:RNA methyltransferase [Oscillospiraceae bacterium]
MEQITSRQNPLIQRFKRLAASGRCRREQGLFLCEGPKLWQEAVKNRWPVEALLASESPPEGWERAERAALVPADLLACAADTRTPQSPVFTCRLPQPGAELPGERLLVLDGVQDPGNVGTIWRTADAFGADGLVLLPGCADPWQPKAVRATMGACFRLPVLQWAPEELAGQLERAEVPLYAAALDPQAGDVRRTALDRAAVVIGSEGRGVSSQVLALCQGTLFIPMRERCESLNAAMAAGIVLWESWRARAD